MDGSTFRKLLVAFMALPLVVLSIPVSEFYPFGPEAGDDILPPSNGGSSPAVSLTTSFPFYGSIQSTAYVSIWR